MANAIYIPIIKGDKGEKGDTPVNGVDYFTETEKQTFKEDVRDELEEEFQEEINENIELSKDIQVRQARLEQKYDEQIKELANENPQLPEIVDARQGFDTLGGVIKQKIFHFDNVASMKNCLTLVAGDVVETLGYYAVNDGGGATYQIVNDNSLVDDGGSVHDLTNGLKAKLIIKDEINVKQFGAYGDNSHDDTTFIQNAIDFITNHATTETQEHLETFNVLTIPSGVYKITDTLELNYFCKIRTSGRVNLLNYKNNNTLIHIIRKDNSNTWISGLGDGNQEVAFIDGTNGLTLCDNTKTATAIEYDYNHDVTIQRGAGNNYNTLSHLRIDNFNIGIKIHSVNTCLLRFDKLTFVGNTTCICFGDITEPLVNSGENFMFNACLFQLCDYVFTFETAFDVNCYDCSFDFVRKGIINSYYNNSADTNYIWTVHVNINGGHLEGFQRSLAEDYGGLINGKFINSRFIFNNLKLFLSSSYTSLQNETILLSREILGGDIGLLNDISMTNFTIHNQTDNFIANTDVKDFLINKNLNLRENRLHIKNIVGMYPRFGDATTINRNLAIDPFFIKDDASIVDNDENGVMNIGNYFIVKSYTGNLAHFRASYDIEDVPYSDITNAKSLVLTANKNGTASDTLHIYPLIQIPVKPGKYYKFGYYIKTNVKLTQAYGMLGGTDIENNSIGTIPNSNEGGLFQVGGTLLNDDELVNKWTHMYYNYAYIPKDINKAAFGFAIQHVFNAGDTIKIGGLFVEEV